MHYQQHLAFGDLIELLRQQEKPCSSASTARHKTPL